MAKKTKRTKITHYESLFDIVKYPANPKPSIYKVTVTEKPLGISTLHYIDVHASPKDKEWSKKARNGPFVSLREDGNGVGIKFKPDDKKGEVSVYLDYAQVHDLKLALEKFHEINKYGFFRKV